MDSNVVDLSVGRKSYRICFPPQDRIGRAVQSGRPYEADLLEAISCLVRPDDVAVDIGANIGNHTLYLAIICLVKVHAYEPNSTAVKYLEENVALNGLHDRVRVFPMALSDSGGSGSLVEREDEPGLHTVRVLPDPLGGIPMHRLDDVEPLNEGRISLIKIDVEGGEPYVLMGAERIIRAHRPVIVAEAETARRRQEIDEILSRFGYWRLPLVFAWTPTYIYLPNKSLLLRFLRRPAVVSRAVAQYLRELAQSLRFRRRHA